MMQNLPIQKNLLQWPLFPINFTNIFPSHFARIYCPWSKYLSFHFSTNLPFLSKNLSFHFSTNLKMCISSWSQQLVQEDSFVHIKILKCVCFFFVNLFYVSLILRPSYKTWVEGSFFSVCFIMYSFILLEYNKNTPILCMNGIHTCLVSDYFKKVLLKTCLYMSFGTCKQVLFWNIYVQKLNCCIGEYVWLKIS